MPASDLEKKSHCFPQSGACNKRVATLECTCRVPQVKRGTWHALQRGTVRITDWAKGWVTEVQCTPGAVVSRVAQLAEWQDGHQQTELKG